MNLGSLHQQLWKDKHRAVYKVESDLNTKGGKGDGEEGEQGRKSAGIGRQTS